jgi:hypothetical protein
LGNTFGSTCGGNTTWLRMANQSTLMDFASAQGKAYFGELGGFA